MSITATSLQPRQAPESSATEFDPGYIAQLNRQYEPLNFEQRLQRIYRDFDADKVLVTSSFAATSAYFLHIVTRICPEQRIHFIDTGFHFPETLQYQRQMIDLFHLNVVRVHAEEWKFQFTAEEKTYQRDPDFCCSVNKVEPLEAIKPNFLIWMSSLMRWQTDHRATLSLFEVRRGIIKFNPMIDVTKEQRDRYILDHQLPFHPLVGKGYSSIGCMHCTVPGEGRSGRWNGKAKIECGLHL